MNFQEASTMSHFSRKTTFRNRKWLANVFKGGKMSYCLLSPQKWERKNNFTIIYKTISKLLWIKGVCPKVSTITAWSFRTLLTLANCPAIPRPLNSVGTWVWYIFMVLCPSFSYNNTAFPKINAQLSFRTLTLYCQYQLKLWWKWSEICLGSSLAYKWAFFSTFKYQTA